MASEDSQGFETGAGQELDPQYVRLHIDGEVYETKARSLTPRELLAEFAGLDPAKHYLIEVRGREQKSFEHEPDTPIEIREHLNFITAKSGPTPVS